MKRYLPFIIIAAVLAISAVSGILVYRSAQPETQPTKAPTVTSDTDFRHVRGDNNAPVTVEEFGDFQCPPCGGLHPELKKMEADYGSRLRVVFHNYPVVSLHKHALTAAHAAEAAGLQGRFWEMHDMLYENQATWKDSDNVRPIFIDYARALNLDVERFNNDMDGTQVSMRILNDQDRARLLRVKGTPTLFVNGRQLPPAEMTTDGIRAAINAALKEKGR
jgi:formate-nitrite transporter family protein